MVFLYTNWVPPLLVNGVVVERIGQLLAADGLHVVSICLFGRLAVHLLVFIVLFVQY